MAITRATDLTVAKSDVAALHVAAAVWDSAQRMDITSATDKAQHRLLTRHASELLELHGVDKVERDQILRSYGEKSPSSNGAHSFDTAPAYTES